MMIGIGIEKEIFSGNYFSYHYGYKNLNDFLFNKKSKLIEQEKLLLEYFKDINFNVLFLNISSKGNYVNFCMNDDNVETYEKIKNNLGIKKYGDAGSFSIKLTDLGKENLIHREIYVRPNLQDFNFDKKQINLIIKDFNPSGFAIGFDVEKETANFEDLHLELYPYKSISSSKHFINTLKRYGVVSSNNFEKYFLKFRKFSHIKIRIKKNQITNIKYYRSINVNVPEFYYESRHA